MPGKKVNDSIPVVSLLRYYLKAETLGTVTVPGNELFICKSIELPWNKNQNGISCIPEGKYLCKWSRSPSFSSIAGKDVFTYELQNVKGRAGIRIHSANFYFQLRGCIALGSALKDINSDNNLDLIHSGKTVKAFNELMKGNDFFIDIKKAGDRKTGKMAGSGCSFPDPVHF